MMNCDNDDGDDDDHAADGWSTLIPFDIEHSHNFKQ